MNHFRLLLGSSTVAIGDEPRDADLRRALSDAEDACDTAHRRAMTRWDEGRPATGADLDFIRTIGRALLDAANEYEGKR